jgi:branched-chain amino acid transport system substrate-binding protein
MNRIILYCFLSLLYGGVFLQGETCAQDSSRVSVQGGDSVIYGGTPREYEPYNRFVKPYKRFFLDPLVYPGYGRQIPEVQSPDTVRIGFIGPIISKEQDDTGDIRTEPMRVNERVTRWDGYQASYLAPIGIKMLQGARLAIEQANKKGGYHGRIPFKLVVRNDNGNWRASGYTIIRLAYQDSVWAVLGSVDGANTHILIRAALKLEIPVMNSADTDPTLVETAIPWIFRCITDDRQMCYLLADFAFKTLGLKRVAALRVTNRYGRICIDEFRDAATRLGFPFITELQYQEGDTDFSDQLQRIRSLNADGIITYGNSTESALILKQMREMGMDQWYLGSDRMVTSEFLQLVGEKAGNVAAGYPYNPNSEDAGYLKFRSDFHKKFNEDPETYAAHAYDGMNMLIRSIEKAGLNRARIRDQLADIKEYKGVTGTKLFDAVNANRSPATLAILRNGEFRFYTGQKASEIFR